VGDDDKRRSDREPVTLVVDYDDADDMVGDYTENLSTGGTFVSTSRALPIGTRVHLSLGFPGLLESIAIEGTVRWTREESDARGAGIEFEPGPGKDQLAAVVDRIRRRDPRTVSKLVRVLVVEDNVHVCQLIEDGLRGNSRRGGGVSFAVRSVQDGRQAIEILRREQFDALIIDVYLPILDGPKVIQQARHELGLGELPIIAVSAGGDSARRSALEAGANIFLDKPMRLRHVLDTIQRLVN
jgi:uncharacterized protein (TIGR02266 family)